MRGDLRVARLHRDGHQPAEELGCWRLLARHRARLRPGAGIQTVLTAIRMPRVNAVMERWVQSCRRKLPVTAAHTKVDEVKPRATCAYIST
ncbi:hypothetical protein [Nonomuraea sp. NPDC003201]